MEKAHKPARTNSNKLNGIVREKNESGGKENIEKRLFYFHTSIPLPRKMAREFPCKRMVTLLVDDFCRHCFNFPSYFIVERESVGADKMAEREFALPDVAMELPSYVPDDYWDRGAGPSSAHPFGVEVNSKVARGSC